MIEPYQCHDCGRFDGELCDRPTCRRVIPVAPKRPEGPAAEPVAWASPLQLAAHDPQTTGKPNYLPIVKRSEGMFTMPLYATAPEAPPPVEARQPPQSELAKSLAWSNDDGWRAQRLATEFHEIYERLAPIFGYETRPDTKQFDPNSKNGKLMIAVCGNILAALAAPAGAIQRGHLGSTPWGETDDH